jgi:hypothetical protein
MGGCEIEVRHTRAVQNGRSVLDVEPATERCEPRVFDGLERFWWRGD